MGFGNPLTNIATGTDVSNVEAKVDAVKVDTGTDLPADIIAAPLGYRVKSTPTTGMRTIPDKTDGAPAVPSGTPYTPGAWVQFTADLGFDAYIVGVELRNVGGDNEITVDVGLGAAGSETQVASVHGTTQAAVGGGVPLRVYFPFPCFVPTGTRVAGRLAADNVYAGTIRCWVMVVRASDLEAF